MDCCWDDKTQGVAYGHTLLCDFILQMMDFILRLMDSALNMMDFVFKMMKERAPLGAHLSEYPRKASKI